MLVYLCAGLLMCQPPGVPVSWCVGLLMCQPVGVLSSSCASLRVCLPPGVPASRCASLLVCQPAGVPASCHYVVCVRRALLPSLLCLCRHSSRSPALPVATTKPLWHSGHASCSPSLSCIVGSKGRAWRPIQLSPLV